MIIDTSALMALLMIETGWEEIVTAITDEDSFVPAPALTEFGLVAAGRGREAESRELLARLIEDGLAVIDFTEAHAALTWAAREDYGKGNGQGSALNLLDLMVYAVARERDEPLLCTGKNFPTTDLVLHPACWPW